MVVYKETLGPNSVPTAIAAVDPLDPPTWTGTWRDPKKSPPADGGRPENALTGTIFMVNGPGTDNPGSLSIKVPASYGNLRFWRNTTIASLAAGQTATLPAGTLGYEWDSDLDNGARPAGTFDLSFTSQTLTTDFLLDQGGIYGAGTATHQMTIYRAPSGALVFGAGTVQWAWGLDANHDNGFQSSNLPADPDMQQATANLFADMGVQPATLQPGLVMPSKSSDTTPPTSTITSPASGATLQFGTAVTVTGTAVDSGGGVVAGVEVSSDGGQTWHPASGRNTWSYSWVPLTAGSVNVLSRAVDDSANLEIPSGGVAVTVPKPPISTDAQASTDGTAASTTVTSPSFSTSTGNELLLAFITTDYLTGTNTTVTNVTGGGLTWVMVVRSNGQSGDSEIWRAFATLPITGATVTATLSQSVISSITVRSFQGVNTTGTNGSGAIGATASKGALASAPSASLTTTQNASWVFAVGNDFDNAIPHTPGTGQSVVHQDLTSTGDTFWVQMQNGPTYTSGTPVTINDTAPTTDRWNLALVEVLPQPTGTLSISGTITPPTAGAGDTVVLTGTASATVTANASGGFTFTNLPNGSYVVTPSHAGYVFTPISQSVTLSGSNVSNVNFTGSATYSISGAISPAAGGSGTTITLGGAGSASTTADSSGDYTFANLVNGSYVVTPGKAGFSFNPLSQNVTVSGASVSGVNFAATATSFSISGSVSAAGANATVSLTGATSASTTADGSGNYSFSNLGNGSYIVTPTKSGYTFAPSSQNVAISGGSVSSINFTAQAVVTVSLTRDVNVSKDGTAASSSITTAAFSTASGNELLLAFISTDYLGGTNTSVTGLTGGGLTWSLVMKTNAQSGDAEIWRAFGTAPLSNVTVTATLSQSVISSITIMSFTGVDLTGTGGSGAIGATASKSSASGAPTATLVTTRNSSWVFGVGNDFSNAIARTVGSGQTLVHQDLTSTGDTYWVQMESTATPTSGTSVTINDSAPTTDSYNLSVVEVLPSLGPYGISGNVKPTVSGVTVTLSGAVNATTLTDASGNYSFIGLSNGSYTATPSKSGTTFTPVSQTVTINGSSQTGVNFAVLAPILTVAPSGVAFSVLQGTAAPTPGPVSITNTGGSTLTYSVTSDSAWLTATPASGSAPQTLQVNANPTGLSPGAYLGHLTIAAPGAGNSPATVTARLNVTVQGDWLMVDHDNVRSGNAPDETTIGTGNVANLKLRWSTVVDGSVTTQPLYVHSVVINGQTRDIAVVGTAGNSLFALDANTGAVIWSRNFGPTTPNNWAIPDGFGIEAPPVIDRATNRLYTVSTDGYFRALNLVDGTDAAPAFAMIANPATNSVWGGLNKLDNYVYIPTASNGGDVAPWRGQVYQVDVSSTPKLVGDFVVVPSIPAPNGGGGIWGYGGVSVDPVTGNIYAASADDSNVSTGGTEGYTPYSDSMIALTENVGLLGYYQPTQPSQYGCSGAPCDLDFASTPIIFQPAGCPTLLAAGNKDGNFFLFRATDLIASGQPLQILTLNVANDSLGSGGVGGVPTYSAANNMLYITDAGPGVTGVSAGIVAMNVTASCTLQVAWSHPLSGNDFPNSTPTLGNGVVYVGEGSTGILHAYNAQTGVELWNSGTQLKAASTFAAPTVANGSVYVGSWTSYGGGGVVGAFAVSTPVLSVSPTSVPFSATVGGSNPSPASANVTNTGSGTFSFTATSDSAWLGVSPASGTAPQALQLSATITGLAAGTYTGHVTVTATGAQGSPATVTVTLTISPAATWSISGNLSANGASASVALSGAAIANTTADASGNYTFSGLANGSYTVTPTKTGYTFNPTSQAVTVNGASISGLNFAASSTGGGPNCSLCGYRQGTQSGGTNVHSDPTSYPALTTSGDVLIVFFQHSNATGKGTVTISSSNGDIWHPCTGTGTGSFVDNVLFASGAYAISCFYSVGITGSADTVTVQASDCAITTCTDLGGLYLEYSGVAPTASAAWDAYSSVSNQTSTSGTNNTASGAVTTSQGNDLIISAINMDAGSASAGTNPITFNMRWAGHSIMSEEDAIWSSIGVINPHQTDSNATDFYGGITVAFK